jgi:lipopolysaccharide transport system ATP-binding protein
MAEIALRVNNLSKEYRIGGRQEQYRTLRDTLTDAFTAPIRRAGRLLRGESGGASGMTERFWALKDVSFEVRRGEVVGIIGRNGAGKSTLLKILSRITEPSSGTAEIYGRVGSLLEVGTGFHPELTGRDNIFLNGAILGMGRAEIERKFDEIVDFAEVEQFIDTPVKHYSSGMYLRLAFAVAAHLEPEILIVDEVLAVGDAAFQKKCLGKIDEVASHGRTVLFVSHNMTAMQSLCDRTVWLHHGRIVENGPTAQVISAYLHTASATMSEQSWPDMESAPGNTKVRIRSARVRAEDGTPIEAIGITTPLALEFEYWNLVPDTALNLSVVLWNEENVIVFNTVPFDEPHWHGRPFPAGLFRSACRIPANLLNDSMYRVQLLVIKDQSVPLYRYDEILTFEVRDDLKNRSFWHGKWVGAVRPQLEWSTEQVESLAVPRKGRA